MKHDDVQATSLRKRPLNLWAFPLGHMAVDWGGGAIYLLTPAIAAELGLSTAQVGLLFTAIMLGPGLVALPVGILGDTIRFRGIFLLITFWWVAIAYLLASLATHYWLLVVLMAIGTAGAMAWHPLAMGELVQRMPERKAFALAVHGIGGTLAQVFAPLSVGFLLTLLSWQRVLQTSTLPAILVGVLFLRLASMVDPPAKRSFTRSDLRDLAVALARAPSVKALSVLVVSGMAVMALASMTPLYLQNVRGASSGFTGLAFAMMMLSGTLAATLMGRLSDRMNRKTVSLAGLLASGGAIALFASVSQEWALLIAMVAIGLTLIGIRPTLMATALEAVGARETSVLGFIFALGEGVGAVGAFLAGLIGGIGLTWSMVFAAALALLSAGILATHPTKSKVWSD